MTLRFPREMVLCSPCDVHSSLKTTNRTHRWIELFPVPLSSSAPSSLLPLSTPINTPAPPLLSHSPPPPCRPSSWRATGIPPPRPPAHGVGPFPTPARGGGGSHIHHFGPFFGTVCRKPECFGFQLYFRHRTCAGSFFSPVCAPESSAQPSVHRSPSSPPPVSVHNHEQPASDLHCLIHTLGPHLCPVLAIPANLSPHMPCNTGFITLSPSSHTQGNQKSGHADPPSPLCPGPWGRWFTGPFVGSPSPGPLRVAPAPRTSPVPSRRGPPGGGRRSVRVAGPGRRMGMAQLFLYTRDWAFG